jgi:hypothetical protein
LSLSTPQDDHVVPNGRPRLDLPVGNLHIALAKLPLTVTYIGLFLEPDQGSCEVSGDPEVPGEFTFAFRVDIPISSAPPEDELVVSADTVGVRFCDDNSDPGPCKAVVNDQTVIQLSSGAGPGVLSTNASVQFLMRFEESFRLHGFVQELDPPGVDLDFSFEELFIGFTLRKGTTDTVGFSSPQDEACQVRVEAKIRVD